jgi:hypothetical protein
MDARCVCLCALSVKKAAMRKLVEFLGSLLARIRKLVMRG